MHGVGRILRQAMVYAKPWQRYVLIGDVTTLGLALVVLGQTKGVILIALGVFMTFEAVRYRNGSRRDDQKQPKATETE